MTQCADCGIPLQVDEIFSVNNVPLCQSCSNPAEYDYDEKEDDE